MARRVSAVSPAGRTLLDDRPAPRRALALLLVGALLGGGAGAMTDTGARAATLQDSVVLDLGFDGSLADASPRASAPTMQKGAAAFAPGIDGQAFSFDGANAINLGTDAALQPTDLTVSFWYKPGAGMSGEQAFAWSKTAYNTPGWYLTSEDDNTPVALSIGSADWQPYKVVVETPRAQFFPADAWTHVVATYDHTTKEVVFYRNGARQTSTVKFAAASTNGTIVGESTSTKTLGFNGPQYNGAHLRGLVDDYRLYSAVASTADVVGLTKENDPSFDPATIARAGVDALTLDTTASADFTLPSATNGTDVSWTSSAPSVIAVAGNAATVTPPASGTATAVLTASGTYGGSAAQTRSFTISVPAVASGSPYLEETGLSEVDVIDPYLANGDARTVDYLLSLDPERFLYSFKVQAGIPTSAQPYGGWERTTGLRFQGHFFGHYLSALSQAYATTSDAAVKSRLLDKLTTGVEGLKQVQDALAAKDPANAGYVAPFPVTALPGGADGLLVPFYNLHKVLAGLLDVAEYGPTSIAGTARSVASKFGTWVDNWGSRQSDPTSLLRTEYGGMNEALYELYSITANPAHKRAAQYFDEVALFRQLAAGQDVLDGLHANTTIPKLIGAMKRYTVFTSDPRLYAVLTDAEKADLGMYRQAAENFWTMVVADHSYVTGANSAAEHFHAPDTLYELATTGVTSGYGENSTAEGCNEYNMLKLTRALFQVDPQAKYADYYETTYINTILASQNPETGMVTYFQPMTAGYAKVFGNETDEFWCDQGTAIESFTKLGDSIYFRKDASVYVTMFRSSVLSSAEQNLRLEQTADIPRTDTATFTVSSLDGGALADGTTVRLRVPGWAAVTPTLTVNGQTKDVAAMTVDGFVVVPVTAGDTLAYTIPADVSVDSSTENPDWVAFRYGPVVLATELSRANVDADYVAGVLVRMSVADKSLSNDVVVADADAWKQQISQNLVRLADGANANGTTTMRFGLRGTDPTSQALVFQPYYSLYDARYALYMNLIEPDSAEAQALILKSKQQQRVDETTIDSLTSFDNNNNEADKNYTYNRSSVGVWRGQSYRDGEWSADAWFQYQMVVDPTAAKNYLGVRYYGGDVGRTFDVLLNGVRLKTERISDAAGSTSWYTQYDEIPASVLSQIAANDSYKRDQNGAYLLDAKGDKIPVVTVRFQGTGASYVGGVYGVYTATATTYGTDADLSALSVQDGTVSPALARGTYDYTLTVPADATQAVVDFGPAVPSGLVYVGDVLIDDTQPRVIPLAAGDAPTSVVVRSVAQDHTTTKEYRLQIVRNTPASVSPTTTSDSGVNADGWSRTSVSVTLTPTGTGASAQYRLAGTPTWAAATSPVVVSAEGRSTVEYRAVRAGTAVAGSEGSVTVGVDRVAPTTSAATTPASGSATQGSTATATFSATDATSGVAATEYSTDGGSTWTSGTTVSFSAVGTYRVLYRSTDAAGNVESARTVTLSVVPPSSIARMTVTSSDAPSADGWYQQPVVVRLEAPSPGQQVQYRINGGTWRTYSSSFTISANGQSLVEHRLLSSRVVVAGSEAQSILKVDRTLPTVSATRSPSATGTPRNPITVTFKGADSVSGLASVEYRLNSGAWAAAPADGAVVLSEVGDWVVSYRSTDVAGNVAAVKSTTVTIAADPVTTVKPSSTTVKPGAALTVSLAGYTRWSDVTVKIGQTVVATVMTDVYGRARVTVVVPADAANGATPLTATDTAGVTATSSVTVKK